MPLFSGPRLSPLSDPRTPRPPHLRLEENLVEDAGGHERGEEEDKFGLNNMEYRRSERTCVKLNLMWIEIDTSNIYR